MSALSMFYDFNVNIKSKDVELKKYDLYTTDKNITTFKFYLFKDKIEDGHNLYKKEVTNFKVKLTVLKPKSNGMKELVGVLDESSLCASYSFKIPNELIEEKGYYTCQLSIENGDEIYTTKSFKYLVTEDIISSLNPDIEGNPDLPILKQLIQEVRDLKIQKGGINDEVISDESTWSSAKINSLLDGVQKDAMMFNRDTIADMEAIENPINGALCWVEEEGIYYNFVEGGWQEFKTGGDGGSKLPYISTLLPENLMVNTGENLKLTLDYNSPNMGAGTLKVLIADVEVFSTRIQQGDSLTEVDSLLLTKGTNKVTVYVVDRAGLMSNQLIFYVRYGGLEFTTTFDSDMSYDVGSPIRYYFIPTSIDTSLPLTFYIEVDGVQYRVSCTSDVRASFTFPIDLEAGRHWCRAWITDGTNRSQAKEFNLVLLNDNNLVIASNTGNFSIEEGYQVVLDYKVFMKHESSFNVKTYIDDNLVSIGTCNLERQTYRNSSLAEGVHTIKVEASDLNNTVSDYVTWTINVTESAYEMLQPTKSGAIFLASAKNRNNADENRNIWQGIDQDDNAIDTILNNFSFNSENGWVNDALIISGDSSVEIPISPLSANARYGFTLDIEFLTKSIGVEEAEVLRIWDDVKNIGIKITTEEAIIKSTENEKRLYFAENENMSVMFIIDRDEKTAKILLNGVVCGGFALGDYVADGVPHLEDFQTDAHLYLGGYNINGYCEIKNIRVYQVALSTNEYMNNYLSNFTNKAEQRDKVRFQKGEDLPTLTIYGDFSGLGKDDKKPCDIVYTSTDITKYGESFTLEGKYSQLQYQGTSSMQYPIKNYRINPRDENGKVKLDPFNNGVGETRFTLKADFASSGHWQNTGLAKWVNDWLYHYDPSDEKSMNPKKWFDLQNGGKLTDTRETINGFPCRLILVNDGDNALQEGQQEPTPGNTKDMGVFNFNNDKSNTKTLGFDIDNFPFCASFEVASNSDTSAGAFMSYKGTGGSAEELAYIKESFELRFPDEDDVGVDYGFLDMNGDSTRGLKRVIDFTDKSSDEDFIAHFEEYFNKQYTFRYFLLVMALG